MKKLILLFAMLSTSAMAQTLPAQSAVVTEHFKTVIQQQPYNVEVCRQVRQANNYYSNGTNSATNELFGAVIGGAIGNKFGKGDGKDAMTLFGALIGASIANDQQKLQQQHQGYTLTTVCDIETRYKETAKDVYSHSIVTFYSKGRRYDVRFTK